MFYLIGLGLSSEKDITLAGLEAIKSCSRVYLESYTSFLIEAAGEGAEDKNGTRGKEILEKLYGKEIILSDREMTESSFEEICKDCDKEDIAFLVVGDPFGATTHSTILLHLHTNSLPYRTIHNASILSAVSSCGIPLYDFGQTISIPFFTSVWRPSSWLDKLETNMKGKMHTLCLLDIKVKEVSEENMARGRMIYEPPRYMSPTIALQQLLEVLEERPDSIVKKSTPVISISRVGSNTQSIKCATLEEMAEWEEETFGRPLHSVVVVSEERIGETEWEWLRVWGWKR